MNDENTPVGNLLAFGVKAGAGEEAGQLSPKQKKKRRCKILLLVVLIAAVIIGIDAAARYRPVIVREWLKSHISSPGMPEYHYYVSDIVSIFDKFPKDAVKFFHGKDVYVLGFIIDMNSTIFGSGVLTLVPADASSGGASVNCHIKESQWDQVRLLHMGESIVLQGECALSGYDDSFFLNDCMIAW